MKIEGELLDGIEVGNAWDDLYDPSGPTPQTNWIVGQTSAISKDSLRFMAQDQGDPKTEGMKAKNISVKWFIHEPAHPVDWGTKKKTSAGRTMSLLANHGKFKLTFSKEDKVYKVTLDTPGDFAIWGPDLEHNWSPIERSTIVTVRWVPLDPLQVEG